MFEKKGLVCLFTWVCLLGFSGEALGVEESPAEDIPAVELNVSLQRGPFAVRVMQPENDEPVALAIFGSGDGGWSSWEQSVAAWMIDQKWVVAGVDLRLYAVEDYDAKTLGADYAAITAEVLRHVGKPDLPVFYGGWSMGAVQAVPAAAWKNHPKNLKGLFLFSADSRGRYGLRAADELGITPKGANTFGLSEFTPAVTGLRIAQFHGTADFMASTSWVRTLRGPHQVYEMPGANHGFDGPSDDFQPLLAQGLSWLSGDESAAAGDNGYALPFGLSPLWPVALATIGLVALFVFSRRHSLRVLAGAVAMVALINLLEALFTKPPSVLDWMEQWLPLGVSEHSRLLLLLSGIGLLGLSRGIRRRKRVAWWMTVWLLGASVVLHLSRAFDWHHALAASVLLVPLLRWRREFVARSDAPTLRLGWQAGLVLVFGLMIYGGFSLRQLSQRGHLGAEFTWADCFNGAAGAIFMQSEKLDASGSREVAQFAATLRAGGLLSGLFVVALALRPVIRRHCGETPPVERVQVQALLERHGRDPMHGFALLPDKHYFFVPGRDAVVAYALWRDFAVVLADPLGSEEDRPQAVREFLKFCRKQDWTPLFYCTHVSSRRDYEEAGLLTFKVGEDARLPVADFRLTGGRYQNLRTLCNKARKEGFTFQWYDAQPQPDHGIEAQLELISNEWLKHKSGGEMTFDLGSFEIADARRLGCAVVCNAENRVEAFATWMPYDAGRGRVLDLMRSRHDVRNVMDFLIVESIDHFKTLGVEEVSLGNAPLADVSDAAESDGSEKKAVRFLFERFDRFYGYKSLFEFKRKYHPDWQGRYLAYPPGVPLAAVGLAVAGVHLSGGFRSLLRS